MTRRFRAIAAMSALLMTASLLAASPAAAGCGWPSCNPARLTGTSSQTISPSGVSGVIRVSFTSSDPYPGAETSVTFNGTSYARWLGSTPFNATSVRLVDSWHADGLGVAVGYPGGIGIVGSGSDASWDDTDLNTWRVEHSFSGVKFHGLDIIGIRENIAGYFKFGVHSYLINAEDDCFI